MHFKLPLLLLVGLMASCGVSKPPENRTPLKLESRVDLERYSGKWFELARLPQWFQRDCISATAEYSEKPEGGIRVVNTCIRADGTERSITGSAVAVDDAANRLKVTFSESWFASLIPIPEDGNYWIIDVTPGYQQAIVGTPSRKYLWLLSRSPEISREAFEKLKKTAEAQGFDLSDLTIDGHTKIIE